MRLGLLQCDHVAAGFRDITGGDYDALFRHHFARYAPGVTLEVFDVVRGDYPTSPSDYDGYLTTGSKYFVYDEAWIGQLGAFVHTRYTQEKKFVGIWFGHQLLASVLGGKVAESPNGWGVGAHNFQVYNPQARGLHSIHELQGAFYWQAMIFVPLAYTA